MEISHKLFTSWLADLTLIGSEDVIKEILKKNLQKFHSLFCKALGLLQGSFPSMLAPRFVSAATSLIRVYNGFIELMQHCKEGQQFIRVFLYSLTWSFSGYILNHDREKFLEMLKDEVELSGYFSAKITWDFPKGKMDGEKMTIQQNIQQNRHCILMGPTGTGKSTGLEKVIINNIKTKRTKRRRPP